VGEPRSDEHSRDGIDELMRHGFLLQAVLPAGTRVGHPGVSLKRDGRFGRKAEYWIYAAVYRGPEDALASTVERMDEMTPEEKRLDELTTAPKSTEADAAPRITVTQKGGGVKRIDVADTATVRPGKP
jgi:hypothetical protein